MHFVNHQNAKLHWRRDGHAHKPALLLINSLGTDISMWDAAMPYLTEDFFVIRTDMRGHGLSDATPGDYDMELLALDAAAVLDAAGIDSANVCGLSIGGMVALQLELTAPERVQRLVICNSSAEVPAAPWHERAALVRKEGMSAVVETVLSRFYSDSFRATNSSALEAARRVLLATPPSGYAACCVAIAGLNVFDKISTISTPTLVINGSWDTATPPEGHGDRIAANIPGASSLTLDAGHISVAEQPEAFARALTEFLA